MGSLGYGGRLGVRLGRVSVSRVRGMSLDGTTVSSLIFSSLKAGLWHFP